MPFSQAIDLRSDTVTRPTPAMKEAMISATVGDDVYGEDPSINALEKTVAKLTGKEAALFVPSGTMANQIAIHLHCRPGDTVVCEKDAHIVLYEAGAAAVMSGVQFEMIPWEREFANDAIVEASYPDTMHSAPSRLLAVENTHNRKAGRAMPTLELERIAAQARRLGMATHCDGARIWNASVALNETVASLAAPFDTIAVCFSKGLGAPVGSALCGPEELILRARKIRKRWGGAMRQAGFLAAAADYALKHHIARLSEDHEKAAYLASALRKTKGVSEVAYPTPGTNMVYFKVSAIGAKELSQKLASEGVIINPLGPGWLRAVTHLDLSQQQIEQAAQIVARELSK